MVYKPTHITGTRHHLVAVPENDTFNGIQWVYTGVGKCPILIHFGNIGHHLIVAIIDHIPNGWVMFNGDI